MRHPSHSKSRVIATESAGTLICNWQEAKWKEMYWDVYAAACLVPAAGLFDLKGSVLRMYQYVRFIENTVCRGTEREENYVSIINLQLPIS